MILRKSRRSGFTLLEMLVIMWSFGVCMALGIALIVTTLKADQSGDTSANLANHRAELSRQFRDDVATASDAPAEFEGAKAGPERLILKNPDGRTIQYVWDTNSLERIETHDDKETRRAMPVGAKVTAIEFVRPAAGSKIFALRWTESAGNGTARRSEFSALLGGNSQ